MHLYVLLHCRISSCSATAIYLRRLKVEHVLDAISSAELVSHSVWFIFLLAWSISILVMNILVRYRATFGSVGAKSSHSVKSVGVLVGNER